MVGIVPLYTEMLTLLNLAVIQKTLKYMLNLKSHD